MSSSKDWVQWSRPGISYLSRFLAGTRTQNASLVYQFGGSSGPTINVPFSELVNANDQPTEFLDGTPECSFHAYSTAQAGLSAAKIVLGESFIRSAYIVYDLTNNQIAIAQAALNATSTSAIVDIPSGTSIPGVSSTATLMVPTSAVATSSAAAAPVGSSSAAASSANANPSSPSFALGSAASPASAAARATSSSTSSSTAVMAAIMPGTWGISGVLPFMTLFGAPVL